jgi:hypothetical protein
MAIFQKSRAKVLGVSFLLLAVTGCAAQYANSPTGANPSAAGATSTLAPNAPDPNYPETGTVGSTLYLPDHSVAITLVAIETYGTRVFFHFRMQNRTAHSFAPIGTGPDYQFVVPRAYSNVTIQATPPTAQADLATHPALPTLLGGAGLADGWVVIDTTVLGEAPHQIDYRYGTVPTVTCTDPTDKSTCKPADLYRALLWNF